jgi:hypothetical protein
MPRLAAILPAADATRHKIMVSLSRTNLIFNYLPRTYQIFLFIHYYVYWKKTSAGFFPMSLRYNELVRGRLSIFSPLRWLSHRGSVIPKLIIYLAYCISGHLIMGSGENYLKNTKNNLNSLFCSNRIFNFKRYFPSFFYPM